MSYVEFLNTSVVLEETFSLCSAFSFSLAFSGEAPEREGEGREGFAILRWKYVFSKLGVPHSCCAGRQRCTDGAGGLFLLFGGD